MSSDTVNTLTYWQECLSHNRDKEASIITSKLCPEGEYLITGSSFGIINIWSLQDLLAIPPQDPNWKNFPKLAFDAHIGNIYSIEFSSNSNLVCAGDRAIAFFDWKSIVESIKNGTHWIYHTVFELTNSIWNDSKILGNIPEVNGIVFDHQRGNILHVACGNGLAYTFDVERESRVQEYKGHADCLYCIKQMMNNQLVTGSEDGTVKIWDSRTAHCTATLEPTLNAAHSKWISCVAIDSYDNWLVCGGGNRYLTMFHVPSLRITKHLPSSGPTQAVMFTQEDTIVSVGNEENVYHWKKNGELIMRVPTSTRANYSVSENTNKHKRILCTTGSNATVDIYAPPYTTVSFSLAPKSSDS